MLWRLSLAATVAFFWMSGSARPAAAATPQTISIQGMLRSEAGAPVSSVMALTISLHDAEIGGSQLYTQTYSAVVVDGGMFDVELGPLSDELLGQAPALWVQTAVDGEAPLPRRRLLSVAYALHARLAAKSDVAGGLQCSGCVTDGQIGVDYALGESQGGAALGLSCSDCVTPGKVSFGYAASAEKGGAAVDLSCDSQPCVSSSEVTFPWAEGTGKGGAAANLQCSGCVSSGDLADGAVALADLSSDVQQVVSGTYAGAATLGGPALDLDCTGCVKGSEIADSVALTGDVTVTSRLGIGTSSPLAPLHVTGDARLHGDLWLYDNNRYIGTKTNHNLFIRTNDQNRLRVHNDGDVRIYNDLLLPGGHIRMWGGNRAVGTTSAHHLYLRTNDENRVTIRDNGRVGIGTNTPAALLHVDGAAHFEGDLTMRSDLWFRDANRYIGTQTDHDLFVRTNDENRLRVQSDGDVRVYNNLLMPGGDIKMWGANRAIGTTSDHHLYLRTNDTTRMTIRNSGRIGIGTTAPGTDLHLVGSMRHDGNRVWQQQYIDAQILAQATCTALRPAGGWTFAIRRVCSGNAPSCAEACAALTEGQAGNLKCFNALHVYGNQAHGSTDQLGLKTYKYNGCGGSYCGPNYCCCGN